MKNTMFALVMLALAASGAKADEVHLSCAPGTDGGYDGPLQIEMNTTAQTGKIVHTKNDRVQEFQNNLAASENTQKVATFMAMENSYVFEMREFAAVADKGHITSFLASPPDKHWVYDFNRVTRNLTLAVTSRSEQHTYDYQCSSGKG